MAGQARKARPDIAVVDAPELIGLAMLSAAWRRVLLRLRCRPAPLPRTP